MQYPAPEPPGNNGLLNWIVVVSATIIGALFLRPRLALFCLVVAFVVVMVGWRST